jgi:hypothetical protein
VKDATGMDFRGRDSKGRYLYRVIGTGWNYHGVLLTHAQRVNFAVLRTLVAKIKSGTELFPAKLYASHGRGEINGNLIWLPLEAKLDKGTCETIAHELVHNDGLRHGRGVRHYSKAWNDREAYWTAKLFIATKGWTTWPKVRGLRDTLSPEQRKARAIAAREAKAAAETPAERWQKKLEKAEALALQWERRAKAATKKAKKWRATVKRAERKLKALAPVSSAAAKPEIAP